MRVVTLGEALGLVRSDEGELARTHTASISCGGAELNVAIALARLGAESAWLGRVGDDPFGARIARDLRAEGVEAHVIVDPLAPTAVMFKERVGAGRSAVSFLRSGSAGSRLTTEDVNQLGIERADHLHVTGIAPALSATSVAAVTRAMDLALENNLTISYDVNHRAGLLSPVDAASLHRRLAARATMVMGDPAELQLVAGEHNDELELAQAVASLGPREVIVKRGARGAAAWDGERWYQEPAVPVTVVDTVGAGDAFVAGYVWSRLSGRTVPDALSTATLTGAAACTHPGDWEGVPTARQLPHLTSDEPVSR